MSTEFVGIRADRVRPLPMPASVSPRRVQWRYALAVLFYHLVALLAFVPWFFSWSGVVLMVVGVYFFGCLGINICYHRLLTHRGFVCAKPLEYALAIIGVCCMQDTPARWVAVHRRHHEHADEQPDPHSPLVNFFWGHMGWMLLENTELTRLRIYERYAKDILRDPFYKWVERAYNWIVPASWLVFLAGGFAAGLLMGEMISAAYQFAASIVIWGVFVRTVIVWHITWTVNSLAHLWGYRNYNTDEDSRNNWLVAILTSGEGWHNNHHADPRAAKHGHRWWEIDLIYLTIRFFGFLGLASQIAMPNANLKRKSAEAHLAADQLPLLRTRVETQL